MKRISHIIILTLAILALASPRTSGQSKKTLRKNNTELLTKVDSLSRALDSLKVKMARDSAYLGMMEENDKKNAAGLDPEDYTPEMIDSLLSDWYLKRQQLDTAFRFAAVDMDSVNLVSNVPDSVLTRRLEEMNSYITLPFNQTVKNYIVLYSQKMPSKMSTILGMCQHYMPIFEEVFNKYGLPEELKYMAVIESALNPTAVSRAGAKGMWQFMHRSAKYYGLEIDSYVDERLDPVKSADAAARYLKDSYNLFGDWNLAISAYNCGPGNVSKAIRRANGKLDFWAVYDYLPRETRGYMPAFVGAMYAINYAKECGITAAETGLPPQVDTIMIRKNVHFQQISDVAGVPMDIIKALNPQYIKEVIPGDKKAYCLRLPYNYTSSFLANEDSVYAYKCDELLKPKTLVDKGIRSTDGRSSIVYTVKSGDYLGKIASRYKVSVNQIKAWNALSGNNLRIGQKLYIYGRSTKSSSAKTTPSESSSKSKPSTDASGYEIYVVKSGDSLYKIANLYDGVSAEDIMKANKIGTRINPGMKLRIPKA